jgi:hypothetical protein
MSVAKLKKEKTKPAGKWQESWTKRIDEKVKSEGLLAYTSEQLNGFCLEYDKFTEADKLEFWRAFFRSWAYLTSNMDTKARFKDKKSHYESLGLFGLISGEAADPFDPEQSIDAAVGIVKKIMLQNKNKLIAPDYFVLQSNSKNPETPTRSYDFSKDASEGAMKKVFNKKHRGAIKRVFPQCF